MERCELGAQVQAGIAKLSPDLRTCESSDNRRTIYQEIVIFSRYLKEPLNRGSIAGVLNLEDSASYASSGGFTVTQTLAGDWRKFAQNSLPRFEANDGLPRWRSLGTANREFADMRCAAPSSRLLIAVKNTLLACSA